MWPKRKVREQEGVPINFASSSIALKYDVAQDFNSHFSTFVPTKVGHSIVAEKVRMTTVIPYAEERDSWGHFKKTETHVKPTMVRSAEPPTLQQPSTTAATTREEDKKETRKGKLGGLAVVSKDAEGRTKLTEEGYRTCHSSSTFKCKFLSKPPRERVARTKMASLVFKDTEEDERTKLVQALPGVSDFIKKMQQQDQDGAVSGGGLLGSDETGSDEETNSVLSSALSSVSSPTHRKSKVPKGGKQPLVAQDRKKKKKKEDLILAAISSQVSERLRLGIDGSSLLPPAGPRGAGSQQDGAGSSTVAFLQRQLQQPKIVALSQEHGMRVTDRNITSTVVASPSGPNPERDQVSSHPIDLAVHIELEDELVFPAGSAVNGSVKVLVLIPQGTVAKVTRRTFPVGVRFNQQVEQIKKRNEIPRGSPLDLLRRKMKKQENQQLEGPGAASAKVFSERTPTLLQNATPMTLTAVPLDAVGRCLLDPDEIRSIEELVLIQECHLQRAERLRREQEALALATTPKAKDRGSRVLHLQAQQHAKRQERVVPPHLQEIDHYFDEAGDNKKGDVCRAKPTMVEVTTDSFYLGSDSKSLWLVDDTLSEDARGAPGSHVGLMFGNLGKEGDQSGTGSSTGTGAKKIQEAMRAFANGEDSPSSFNWTSRYHEGHGAMEKASDRFGVRILKPQPFEVITQAMREKHFKPNYDTDLFEMEKYEAEITDEINRQKQQRPPSGGTTLNSGVKRQSATVPATGAVSVGTTVPVETSEYFTLKQNLAVGYRRAIDDAYASGANQVEVQRRHGGANQPGGKTRAESIEEAQDDLLGVVQRPESCLLRVEGSISDGRASLMRLAFPKAKSSPQHTTAGQPWAVILELLPTLNDVVLNIEAEEAVSSRALRSQPH